MNLFPQDLGEKRAQAVIAQRLTSLGLHMESSSAGIAERQDALAQPVGWWGRLWMGKRSRQISRGEAQFILRVIRRPARACVAFGLLALPVETGLFLSEFLTGAFLAGLLAGTGWLWLFAGAMPRRLFRLRYTSLFTQPLTGLEIASLLPAAHDELERSYLTLMMDVIRQEIASAPGADLRPALRALGDAIDRLPATRAMGGDSPDIMTEVLRRTAAETLLVAQAEPDRVVAASLMRRVEALHRRADATGRANLLVRRFSALRQEMAAETEALRAGLAAYYTGSHDVADLSRLAEDVQRVAAEAAAMTAAVEEVDGWSSGGTPQVGVPAAPSADAPLARLQLGQ